MHEGVRVFEGDGVLGVVEARHSDPEAPGYHYYVDEEVDLSEEAGVEVKVEALDERADYSDADGGDLKVEGLFGDFCEGEIRAGVHFGRGVGVFPGMLLS